MRHIRRKLNSNTGASMILALVLVLICAMVSSVIVMAAASGVSRNESKLKKQQEYLAVTSAAQFIAENLNPSEDSILCGVIMTNEKPCAKYKNYNIPFQIDVNGVLVSSYAIPMPAASIPGVDNTMVLEQFYLVAEDLVGTNAFCEAIPMAVIKEDATEFSGYFGALMKRAASDVFKNNAVFSESFTMEVGDDRLPKVKCTFTMEKDYSVDIVIHSVDEVSDYSMTVRMDANQSTNFIEDEVECTNEHRYFYEYSDMVGNLHTSEIGYIKFNHTVKNSVIEVTWGSPVISKGGK